MLGRGLDAFNREYAWDSARIRAVIKDARTLYSGDFPLLCAGCFSLVKKSDDTDAASAATWPTQSSWERGKLGDIEGQCSLRHAQEAGCGKFYWYNCAAMSCGTKQKLGGEKGDR